MLLKQFHFNHFEFSTLKDFPIFSDKTAVKIYQKKKYVEFFENFDLE